MRKLVLLVCAIALIVPGCVTTPPWSAIGNAATPKITGPESGYSGYGTHGAHEWTDDDARTALWLRRNLPERWAEVPFPIIELFRYNQHNHRQQTSPFEWDYYFADMNDPELQVRMFTVEARDRNRTRRNEVISKRAAEEAAAQKAITGDVADLSDKDVEKKLQTVFP